LNVFCGLVNYNDTGINQTIFILIPPELSSCFPVEKLLGRTGACDGQWFS